MGSRSYSLHPRTASTLVPHSLAHMQYRQVLKARRQAGPEPSGAGVVAGASSTHQPIPAPVLATWPHGHDISSALTPFLSSRQLKTARNGKNLKNICKDFYTGKAS